MKLSQKFFARLKQVTQVNHCLRHTYFKNLKLSQKIFARPDKSTKSTSNCNTYIFEIISLSRISWLDSASQPSQPLMTTHIFSKSTLSGNFCEKWRVTQVNQHLQRICFGQSTLEKIVATVWQVNHFNSVCNTYNLEKCNLQEYNSSKSPKSTTHVRHTYFQKLSLLQKVFASLDKSPKSTTVYDIHNFRK